MWIRLAWAQVQVPEDISILALVHGSMQIRHKFQTLGDERDATAPGARSRAMIALLSGGAERLAYPGRQQQGDLPSHLAGDGVGRGDYRLG